MMSTNYNDGLWHGWNGGECPVHPKTKVELVAGNWLASGIAAGEHDWGGDQKYPIIAFRVVKEFQEPREWRIVGGFDAFSDEADWRDHIPARLIERRIQQFSIKPAAQDGEAERLRGLEANTYAASKAAFNDLAAERDAIQSDKEKLEWLVDTLAEALSAIDPAGKLDCELRANALAEYQKWKEWK